MMYNIKKKSSLINMTLQILDFLDKNLSNHMRLRSVLFPMCHVKIHLRTYIQTNYFYFSDEIYLLPICECSNANPLHYYALRVPRKVDRWR